MKILYILNVPSPYRVDYFNELGKYCDLTVLFERESSEERDASWLDFAFKNFKGIFLKGKSYKVDSSFCPSVVKYLKRNRYDYIICANFTSITGMLAIEYMRLHGMKYYLESDGGFPKSGKGFKEWLKKHFIKGAEGYFSTGATHDGYYLAYGAPRDKLIRYPFTSLKTEDLLKELPTKEEKQELKDKLGITEENVVLSIGQFVHRKGFDTLIKAAKSLPENTGIYIVGGEPTEEYSELVKSEKAENVHFIGFKRKEELKEYYMASDVFVLLTREDIWGLVINEAMAMGLPVITTDKCIAGLELIENGKNGYIIPADDELAAAEKLSLIINEKSAEKLGENALATISDYTFEGMAKAHLNIFGVKKDSHE